MLARIKRCNLCPHKVSTGAWEWPRCFFGYDLAKDAPRVALELSDEYVNHPLSRCPAGFWEGLGEEWIFPSRKVVCGRCEHSRVRGPYDSNLCVQGGVLRERDSVFMFCSEMKCPAGKWKELKPLRILPTAEERSKTRFERQKQVYADVLVVALKGEDAHEVIKKLAALVEKGKLDPDVAEQIAKEIGAIK